jgi:glutamate formiminotransferase
VLECVPNVSEGRDTTVLDELGAVCGLSLLDRHEDRDHHRSVFTLAGPGPHDAEHALRALAGAVARLVRIDEHEGVHPRLGALDVVPFVALGPSRAEMDHCIEAARSFARWWAGEHGVPCFLYDDADDDRSTLPDVRRRAFRIRAPHYGPAQPHPTLGATAVGARPALVAVNCVLADPDITVANRIARKIRESDGGLAGVRALAFELEEAAQTQVSMNLVDLERTGLEDAVLHVRDLALAAGTDVVEVELIGLLPGREMNRCSADFLRWADIDIDRTVERHIEKRVAERDAAASQQ